VVTLADFPVLEGYVLMTRTSFRQDPLSGRWVVVDPSDRGIELTAGPWRADECVALGHVEDHDGLCARCRGPLGDVE
jgi:hypothetical protein